MPRLIRSYTRAAPTALIAILALAGCTPQTQDQIARSAAKSTVNRVVLERYPGLPVEPAINCIIDNANSTQIVSLAADSVTGPTDATGEVVTAILRKPETLQCLSGAALSEVARL